MVALRDLIRKEAVENFFWRTFAKSKMFGGFAWPSRAWKVAGSAAGSSIDNASQNADMGDNQDLEGFSDGIGDEFGDDAPPAPLENPLGGGGGGVAAVPACLLGYVRRTPV